MNALYILCGLGLLSLLAEITSLKRGLTVIALIGLVTAAVFAILDWNTAQHYYGDMLFFDNFAVAFTALLMLVAIFWLWMSPDYFSNRDNVTDRSALILFALTGAVIMVSFNNMAMLFLGVEILSISLYALAGSRKDSLRSNEASFKYFLMGSFATGFLLMGITLVYGATRSFNLIEISTQLSDSGKTLPGFFSVGVLLMFVGLAFKISAVPFHFWAPDVYEGSPVSITAFMATVAKIASVGAFYKVFSSFTSVQNTWSIALQAIVVLTLLIPSITAVYQSSVKRMLAYSSVGQAGYILLAFVSAPQGSKGPILYYLSSYAMASLVAFAVLQKVGENGTFLGLLKRNSLLALGMVVALFSLAGIPPLAGFFAKYLLLSTALANGYVALVGIAIVASLIGVYYYFKVILQMVKTDSVQDEIALTFSFKLGLVLLLLSILALGLFPDQLITLLI